MPRLTRPDSPDIESTDHVVTTDLAVASEATQIAVPSEDLASLLEETSGEGFENVTRDEFRLPRLVILQPTSPLVAEDPERYRAGHLVNSITGANYGNAVNIHPLHFFQSRVHWEMPEPGSPIDCKSEDGFVGSKKDAAHSGGRCRDCTFKDWGDDGSNPACTQFKNIMLAVSREDENLDALVFSAKRTAIRAINTMLTEAKSFRSGSRVHPFYSHIWRIESEKQQRERQTWFIPKFSHVRMLTNDEIELFKTLREMSADMQGFQSNFVIEQDVEPGSPVTAEDEIPF